MQVAMWACQGEKPPLGTHIIDMVEARLTQPQELEVRMRSGNMFSGNF